MKNERIKRVSIKNVSKTFNIDIYKNRGLGESILNIFSSKNKKKITPVNNVSFDVYSGESIGILGNNGAGKSTLLRLIAGIYEHDEGQIETFGKVLYMDGFGKGLQPRLTMRQNIYLLALVRGIKEKDIKSKFNEIVEFSGLEEHLDQKIYQFSTGMITRLVFSISIFCLNLQNPNVLLIDEVLNAGGDSIFQKKSGRKLEELIEGGASLIFVSHAINNLRKYCSKTILLEQGRVVKIGPTEEIIKLYLRTNKIT